MPTSVETCWKMRNGSVYIPSKWLAQSHLTHADILSEVNMYPSRWSQSRCWMWLKSVIDEPILGVDTFHSFRIGILVARRVYHLIGLKLLKAHDAIHFTVEPCSANGKSLASGLGIPRCTESSTFGLVAKYPDSSVSKIYRSHSTTECYFDNSCEKIGFNRQCRRFIVDQVVCRTDSMSSTSVSNS